MIILPIFLSNIYYSLSKLSLKAVLKDWLSRIFISVIIVFCLTLSGCTRVFFFPTKQLTNTPASYDLEFQNIWMKSDDLKIHGWFLPGHEVKKPCVLFLHGTGGNVSTYLNYISWLPKAGFSTLVFDYRGFGLSEGSAELWGVRNDAHTALEFISKMNTCQKSGVFVFGQSLGAVTSIELVATTNEKVKGLIVDSPFSSYREILRDNMRKFWLTWPLSFIAGSNLDDSLSPIHFANKIGNIPKLIIHGTEDKVVSIRHSEIIYDELSEQKEFLKLEGLGHVAGTSTEALREKILSFLSDDLASLNE